MVTRAGFHHHGKWLAAQWLRERCAIRIGALFVAPDDRIVETSDTILASLGDIRGKFGWSLGTLGCGRPATADDARIAHALIRSLGKLIIGGYQLTGPKGTIYIDRAECHPIGGANIVVRVRFCLIGAENCGTVMAIGDPMHTSAMTGVVGRLKPEVPTISEAVELWAANMRRLGCKSRSIDRFTKKTKECAGFCDWHLITSVRLEDAERWLTHKRETCDWSGPTHDQACSILRCFGEFIAKRKMVPVNPLEHLESSGEQGGEGSRALRTAEVQSMIAEAWRRRQDDARARGNVPAFFMFLCLTGLRHDEAACCKWKDIDMGFKNHVDDSGVLGHQNGTSHGKNLEKHVSTPALYSDPAWAKNGKRMRVALNTEIQAVLSWHRTLVRHGPNDLVFPIVPNRHTWQKIREAAKVDDEDGRGRAATFHSMRKWFATELDRAGASQGVVSRLLRHAGSLAEERYIDPDATSEILAVSKLPTLWPENASKIFHFSLEHGKENVDYMGAMTESTHQVDDLAPGIDAESPSSQAALGVCRGPARLPTGGALVADSRSAIESDNGHSNVDLSSRENTHDSVRSNGHGSVGSDQRRGSEGTPRLGGHSADHADRQGRDCASGRAAGTAGAEQDPQRSQSAWLVCAGQDGVGYGAGGDIGLGRADLGGGDIANAAGADLAGRSGDCAARGPRIRHTEGGSIPSVGFESSPGGFDSPGHGVDVATSGPFDPCGVEGHAAYVARNASTGHRMESPNQTVRMEPSRETRTAGVEPGHGSFDSRPASTVDAATPACGGSHPAAGFFLPRAGRFEPSCSPPGFSEQLDEALTGCAGALRRTAKGSPRMVALLGLSVALSALAHVQDVTRGYIDGKQCAQGSGCLTQPTIAACILCCQTWCNHSGFLADCQNACLGSGGGGSNETVYHIALVAEEIRTNRLSGNDLAAAVSVIELAMNSTDERVATFARAIGGETPMVAVH